MQVMWLDTFQRWKSQAMSVNTVASSVNALVMRMAPTGAVRDAEEEPPEPDVGELPGAVPEPGSGVPDEPPAASDSCAKPTAGGLARKTLYTFLRNVSPMIHAGLAPPGGIDEPWVISKIAPRHLPLPTVPRFKSARLIGHDGPPKDIATDN